MALRRNEFDGEGGPGGDGRDRGGGGNRPEEGGPLGGDDRDRPEEAKPPGHAPEDSRPDHARPTPDELTELLDQCHGLMAAVERRFLDGVRSFDALEGWRPDGARSMAEWLAERYGMSRERANGYVVVAHELESMPELAKVYESGEVSLEQVKPVLRATADRRATGREVNDEDLDARLAGMIPGLSEPQCRELARRIRLVTAEEREMTHAERHLRFSAREDHFAFSGRLSVEDGATFEAALLQLIATPAQSVGEDGTRLGFGARAADALVEMAALSLARSQEEGEADAATVVCHVGIEQLLGLDGTAELANGMLVPGETARRLLCDCRLQVLAENPDGTAVGVGRISRIVPRWLRRQLDRRDGGCRFPGCSARRFVDRHHIWHWGEGGRTDPDNLVTLCRYHHRFVHEHHWEITGDPAGEIAFAAPDGRQVTSRPSQPDPVILQRFGLLEDDSDDAAPPPGRSRRE